jgi:3-deoxy-D-manno-octulosonate 8-phosphate phosphatase (KDO 8-P phosphatase)
MPSRASAPEIGAARARAVRLVIFDVDGVLTDAGVYTGVDAEGRPVELKRFDIQDGLGIKLLQRAGIEVAFVSGRLSEANRLRALELEVSEFHQDPDARKIPLVEGILARTGVSWDESAMLADDLPDLAVFRRVGLRAAVANAQPEIVALAHWRSTARGGAGAAREFCRALLTARGEWDRLVEEYERERS